MKLISLFFAALLALSGPAFADSRMPQAQWANRQLADSEQEKVARALMEDIRCLVCQGQSIADSDAETAGDMRALIRQRIAAGERPEAVKAWLIDRYGAYITYSPPFGIETILLWLVPVFLLFVGIFMVRGRLKASSR